MDLPVGEGDPVSRGSILIQRSLMEFSLQWKRTGEPVGIRCFWCRHQHRPPSGKIDVVHSCSPRPFCRARYHLSIMPVGHLVGRPPIAPSSPNRTLLSVHLCICGSFLCFQRLVSIFFVAWILPFASVSLIQLAVCVLDQLLYHDYSSTCWHGIKAPIVSLPLPPSLDCSPILSLSGALSLNKILLRWKLGWVFF